MTVGTRVTVAGDVGVVLGRKKICGKAHYKIQFDNRVDFKFCPVSHVKAI